jgi:hypothetical protein
VQEEEIMILPIVGVAVAIFVLEFAAGMLIGRWLFPPEPKQDSLVLPQGEAPSVSAGSRRHDS